MTRPYSTMNANDRRQVVQKALDRITREPHGYFFYKDNYELGGVLCFGSVLSVEYRCDDNLNYIGCIVNVGSVLDYTVKLDTLTGIITASNSTDEPLTRIYDRENCEAVDLLWQDAYDERRKQCCS